MKSRAMDMCNQIENIKLIFDEEDRIDVLYYLLFLIFLNIIMLKGSLKS
jgi:hypothetical protein